MTKGVWRWTYGDTKSTFDGILVTWIVSDSEDVLMIKLQYRNGVLLLIGTTTSGSKKVNSWLLKRKTGEKRVRFEVLNRILREENT
jgi:hypothetical protein